MNIIGRLRLANVRVRSHVHKIRGEWVHEKFTKNCILYLINKVLDTISKFQKVFCVFLPPLYTRACVEV